MEFSASITRTCTLRMVRTTYIRTPYHVRFFFSSDQNSNTNTEYSATVHHITVGKKLIQRKYNKKENENSDSVDLTFNQLEAIGPWVVSGAGGMGTYVRMYDRGSWSKQPGSGGCHTSVKVTAPLVKLVLQQSRVPPKLWQSSQRSRAKYTKRNKVSLHLVFETLPNSLKKTKELASEKGASSWLTTLPITDHCFRLHKGAFCDALCLRYNYSAPLLPSSCVCGSSFQVDHALSCHCGGFPSIRHNKLRDLTAHLLTEVCSSVGVEPALQPLGGERMDHRTANSEDNARLDIKQTTSGAGTDSAFFDIRVFNPLAPSNWNHTLTSCYHRNEQEKRRAYDQRVRKIEHGNFTPLVFSASGRMGPVARVFYEKLVSMIAIKHNRAYSKTLNWMRCKISFSLLRSAVMCLRGSRSFRGCPALPVVGEGDIWICTH